jgi:hypothetical protein
MMRASEIARPGTTIANEPQHDAVVRLTPLGWTQHLVLIVVLIAASFFLCGYFVVYWRNADMDLVVVYNALAMNDGRAQAYFDHPAFISILAVKLWFQLLHQLGLLSAWKLSLVPSAADVPAFDAAMTNAVRAGRLLAWMTATTFVLAFASLTRVIVRDWRIAALATCAFAFSGGVEVHVRILRSEMIAASFVLVAFMILIIVARRATVWRPLAIGGAAALCILSLENKVQAILLIGALPLLALPFGSVGSTSVAFWRNTQSSWLAAALAAIVAGWAAWAAWPLIATGFDRALLDAAHFRPLLFGRFGIYQTALLVLIVACMAAFSMIWRISASETLASMFAIAAGALIALLALDLEYNAGNVIVVCNPLEKMLTYADAATTDAAIGTELWKFPLLVIDGVPSVLARYTFVLHSSPRPTVFLTWLIIPGIILAWRHGERQAAIQSLMLLVAAVGIDALNVQRGLKVEYFVFTDPLIILGGALLLSRITVARHGRRAYPIGAALIVLHVSISQAEPVKYLMKRSGPDGICEWNQWYLPLMPLPWCALPPRHR